MKQNICRIMWVCLLLSLVLACAACGAVLPPIVGPAVRDALPKVQDALEQQLDTLYDRYAYYYQPDEYRTMMEDYEGSFGGVGISMINNEDGNIEVYIVMDSGPAKDTEIEAGDVILSVDGESLLGCDISIGVSHIRGDVGTPVTLGLRHADGREYEVTIVRQVITSESVRGEMFEELPRAGYIYIYDFTEQTSSEFIKAFNTLADEQSLSTLILDLRSNGGGSLNGAVGIANLFIPKGHLIFQEKTASGTQEYKSSDGQLHGMKLVVLINQYSASASEVLAGALRDEAGAVLIGTTSYGKGVTQSIGPLPSGAGIRFSCSQSFPPSGYDLHGVGLTPDVEVPLAEDLTREQYWSTDPAENPCLDAARDYLLGR